MPVQTVARLVILAVNGTAVESGAPSVGVRAANGSVLAVEKKFTSKLVDPSSINRIEPITANIGMVYSGLYPDYRLLVKQARKIAEAYKLTYGESISPEQLVSRMAAVMQEYTQSGGVRPFGVSLLITGWDEEAKRLYLYQCDPAGTYFAWKATALGKNSQNGKTFFSKRYNEKLELDDAVHASILALKEGFEGQMTENNIEIGVCNHSGFRVLSSSEVKDYLDATR